MLRALVLLSDDVLPDDDDDLDEPDDANAFVDDERKSSLRAAPCVSRGCP